jgi:hypothetical protein
MTVAGVAHGHATALDRREARTPDFRAMLGEAAWAELPAAVRARFDAASHAAPREYPGAMQVRMNWLGRLFAQACRAVGSPLAPRPSEGVPVRVVVRREPTGGVSWERIYAYPGRTPLSIVSMKLAAADGALLEVTRGGIGMRLTLGVEAGALVFRSTAYFWRIGPLGRLGPWLAPLPDLLTPGRCTVVHRDLGGDRFHFALSFRHPLAGETIVNAGDFQDPSRKTRP